MVAGVPGQLPDIAMGWVLLFHMERAAALLGVIGRPVKRVDFIAMASAASKYELTDEVRAKIIEKARRELPERDRRYQEAIEGLRRVARGLPGRP